MELYNCYNLARMVAALFAKNDRQLIYTFYWGLGVGVAIWLGLFLLQGIGLFTMAKRRGFKKSFLAFIPFVNLWYIGKLAGDCNFFGQKVKRAGMYAMIAQIIITVLSLLALASEMYLWISFGVPEVSQMGSAYWTGLTGFALTVSKFFDISAYLLSIFQLAYEILLVILLMGLYKQYAPNQYMVLGVLTLFIPLAHYIVIFALRNRAAIDYNAFMRAKHEAYMRQQQEYRNHYNPYNPYNNPYGNPYHRGDEGGYGAPYNNGRYGQNTPPEEPFAEFSSSNGNEERAGNDDADSDGFFD